eukprot:scaffold22609_cov101-Isochrysis_galbana.AAC.1
MSVYVSRCEKGGGATGGGVFPYVGVNVGVWELGGGRAFVSVAPSGWGECVEFEVANVASGALFALAQARSVAWVVVVPTLHLAESGHGENSRRGEDAKEGGETGVSGRDRRESARELRGSQRSTNKI